MNEELYHHGVKGMKWGVRRRRNNDGSHTSSGKKRVSNKEVRNARKKAYKTEYEKLDKEYGITDKRKKAIAYGEKHKLDLDDGGGGDAKAGRKYMSMWDEIDKLDDRADTKANARAKQYVIDTYGEKKK